MSDQQADLKRLEALFTMAVGGKQQIWLKTRSGRKFRFDVSKWRVSPDTPLNKVRSIAREVANEKHRRCQWDRMHPHVDSRSEIQATVHEFFLGVIARMNEYMKDNPTTDGTHTVTVWNAGVTITHTRVYRSRLTARLQRVWIVVDNQGQHVEQFHYTERRKADELARELSRVKQAAHYVQPGKDYM